MRRFPAVPASLADIDPNRIYRLSELKPLSTATPGTWTYRIKRGQIKAYKLPGLGVFHVRGYDFLMFMGYFDEDDSRV